MSKSFTQYAKDTMGSAGKAVKAVANKAVETTANVMAAGMSIQNIPSNIKTSMNQGKISRRLRDTITGPTGRVAIDNAAKNVDKLVKSGNYSGARNYIKDQAVKSKQQKGY
jgi:hypothetical protein